MARRVLALASALGEGFLDVAQVTGGMGVMFARLSARLLRLKFDRSELLRQLHRMGVSSLPIVVVTALFVGAIMVVQAAPLINRYGAQALLGWAAGFSTLREIGPLLTALMLSGRVGANNTAELGTMVVTEQIDALRALAIDPLSYLLVPRFAAMVVTFFLSTVFSDVLALLGAAIVGQVVLGVDALTFYHGVTGDRLTFVDVAHGLIKSATFGLVIGLASCTYGLSTSGGAPGVGRSVTSSVVVSAIGVFAIDYFMSFLIH
ncbi:MAG TPA: ABC transporter permease [Polyangiaceae bacterium]|jgi:phospholipid/cholesterol/gamma-HCH transport system permease protein|nr:ABC transporter permease [Polyangiaceae bacterium]